MVKQNKRLICLFEFTNFTVHADDGDVTSTAANAIHYV